MNNNEFNIKVYDFDMLPSYPFILLASARRSGKTTALLQIVYEYFIKKEKYKRIFVCCPTARLTTDYNFIEDDYIQEDFTEDFVNELLEEQYESITQDPESNVDTLLILDDVAMSVNRKTIDLLGMLSSRARHSRLAVIMATQNFRREVSPILRSNLDILVVWKQRNEELKKDIVKMWLSLNNPDEGYEIMNVVPEKYRTLVIDNTKTSSSIEDYVFHKTFKQNSIPKNFKFFRNFF